jgi:hypothetical protein
MPLAHIYNASLEAGIFPERFKIAKVKPLHKKGDKKEMKNYRPISLLCVFSKILEKLMYNRLLSFVTRNTNILSVEGMAILSQCHSSLVAFLLHSPTFIFCPRH